jgi:hypothetical protein
VVTPHHDQQLFLVVQIIGIELPSRAICDVLLCSYFEKVHWFSLVVYEAKFRSRYERIMSSNMASQNDHTFLLLLLMLLALGSWYQPDSATEAYFDGATMRQNFLNVIRQRFLDVMDEESLEFLQLCALLGSFYLYHGLPRSALSLLGAATRTAQAMRLHRRLDGTQRFDDTEERKRVWWTLYTWDRYEVYEEGSC